MAGSATLVLSIVADTKDAVRGLNDTESAAGKFKSTVGKLALPAAAAVGGLIALGKAATDSASEQQQAMGALDSVYGPAAAKAKAYAETAATAVGLSKTAYANASAAMGASLKALGFDQGKAADASAQMISLGADLAATFGGTAADAVDALGATLRGEYDSSEKYGLGLSAATVQAELAAKGQDKLEGKAAATAKAQATLDIATRNAADSTGQFAKESGTAAGAQEIANAKYEDARAALGEKLLPVMATLTDMLGQVFDWISKNTQVVGIIVGVIGGLAAAILIVNGAIAAWNAIMVIVNLTIWSSPIFWIIAAVVALVAVIVIIATKTKWFQQIWDAAFSFISKIVKKVFDWIKKNWPLLLTILGGPIGLAVALIIKNFDKIKAVVMTAFDAVKGAVGTVVDAITTAFNAVKTAAEVVFNWLKNVFAPVFDVIKQLAMLAFYLIVIPIFAVMDAGIIVYNWLKSVFAVVFNFVKDQAVAAFNLIMVPVQAVWDALVAVYNWLKGVFAAVWGFVKDQAVKAFDLIMSALQAVHDVEVAIWNWIKNVFSAVWGYVSSAAVSAFNLILGPINAIKSAAEAVYNWLKNVFNAGWTAVKDAAVSALNLILGPINAIKSAFDGVIGVVKSVIDWISKIKIPDLGGIASKLNPFSKSAPAPAVATSAVGLGALTTAATARVGGTANSAGGVTIVIQGAIDPVSTAKQIRQILRDDTRRRGGVVVGLA